MTAYVAIAGKQYHIYRQWKYGFLHECLQGDCPCKAKNITKFEAHMREHGFRGVDHVANERLLAELKNRCRVRATPKRKSWVVPTARDYLHLRSNLKTVWNQTLMRKYRCFVAEAISSGLFRFGPEPKAPQETVFTVMIEGLLLLDRRTNIDFWAERWDFDLQDPKRINEKASKQHEIWVQKSKSAVLEKLRASLVQKFASQFLVSEEEAIEKLFLDQEPKDETDDPVLPTLEKWIVLAYATYGTPFRRQNATRGEQSPLSIMSTDV
ncbi:hypothetical protein R1sor_012918 [Riccia sorocarpa]|uniref:Transposase n=1 Tax=Riccia sorocarpa TaxID=122646 RepID=A0ABD3I7W6_9MARC